MSLYVDLQRRIYESDSEEAIEILQSIWEQRADMGQLTACFLEPASASLQLRFDTPHAMICLDSLSQLLEMIPSRDHLYFLEGFVRYLSGLPKISIDFKGIEYIGSLGIKSGKKDALELAKERMVEILETHKPTPLTSEQEAAVESILNEARNCYRKRGLISDEEWADYLKVLN